MSARLHSSFRALPRGGFLNAGFVTVKALVTVGNTVRTRSLLVAGGMVSGALQTSVVSRWVLARQFVLSASVTRLPKRARLHPSALLGSTRSLPHQTLCQEGTYFFASVTLDAGRCFTMTRSLWWHDGMLLLVRRPADLVETEGWSTEMPAEFVVTG